MGAVRGAPSLSGGLCALVLVGLAAACGGSGHQFVENGDLGVYAKLPGDWTVYDDADLFPDDSDRQLERRRETMWVQTFDASGEPSVEASQAPGGAHPTGIVQARLLSPEEREQINLSALRGLGNPQGDPVAAAGQDNSVEVLLDEPVEFDGGYHGVHTVFSVRPQDDGDAVFTDRTVLLDAPTTTMFVFQVACEEECFLDTHGDEIADVVDSWTIQEGTS